jgi:hypothetical protein
MATDTRKPRKDLVNRILLWYPPEARVPSGEEQFCIRVTVVEARRSYGRDELLIQPVAGRGRAWVSMETMDEHAR